MREAQRFAAVAATDRLHAAWLLSLHGLRRGEVLGLHWSAIDWEGRTIAITQARVSVSGVVHVSDPKTARGRRELSLTEEVAAARARRTKRAATSSSTSSVARCARRPAPTPSPALARRAEVSVIRLHDARHTSVSLKRSEGWPDHPCATSVSPEPPQGSTRSSFDT